MKSFKDLHPVLQLTKLDSLYWNAVEGDGGEKAIQKFNTLKDQCSDYLLQDIGSTGLDPYLIAHYLQFLPPRVLAYADLCLISGIDRRIAELKHFSEGKPDDYCAGWAGRMRKAIKTLEVVKVLIIQSK